MKIAGALLLLVLSLCIVSNAIPKGPFKEALRNSYKARDAGGGVSCAGCTIATSIIEQLAVIKNQTTTEVLDEFCLLFPAAIRATCVYYVDNYGIDVVRLLEAGLPPDGVCHGIGFCTDPTCKLWSQRSWDPATVPRMAPKNIKRAPQWNPWQWLEELINRFGQNHEPIDDFDGDFYSQIEEFRGTSWRGRDCHDFDSTIHPGRNIPTVPPQTDHNCNGIYQVGNNDYEKLYCAGSGQLGAVVFGDSAGAHFHIPGEWMNASAMNSNTYDNLLFAAANELDWPHLSAWTGYIPSSLAVPVDSIYLRLRERNLCNHRDYQNVAVNGMRSGPVLDLLSSFARNQTTDYPALVLLELIGNDVCSGHHDFDHFTTVPEFKQNVLAALNQLDTMLPPGSHVAMMGLAQGSILWDTMHARTHPVGATYKEVYGFLNCLELSPCWTWMNHNETVRNAGDLRAAQLSAVYPEIVANYKFKNFDMKYFDFPLKEIEQIWKAQGGELWQLIEPIDGFHPNQQFNALLAGYYWDALVKLNWVGKVNPNNAKIQQSFGNQGGY